MTEQEKQLLLVDLCARLAYGVKVERNGDVCKVLGIIDDNIILTANVPTNQQTKIVNIKPYLRPMSSMTEEEKKEFLKLADGDDDDFEDIINYPNVFGLTVSIETFDWLNSHHFDYRGLIKKGLALEAPEGMYKNN